MIMYEKCHDSSLPAKISTEININIEAYDRKNQLIKQLNNRILHIITVTIFKHNWIPFIVHYSYTLYGIIKTTFPNAIIKSNYQQKLIYSKKKKISFSG